VTTPFGVIHTRGHAEGAAVHVLIRPEALKVGGAEQGIVTAPPIGAIPARVLASRLLGRTSWVHVCLSTDPTHRHDLPDGAEEHSHWHVRVPGQFLPDEGAELRVSLDPRQAFVFAVPAPT
jgi:iron(III) transport system ATP-binding protein